MSLTKGDLAEAPTAKDTSSLKFQLEQADRVHRLREILLSALQVLELLQTGQPASAHYNLGLRDQLRRFEINLIRSALQRTNGNQRGAARLLGMKVTTLNYKIKQYKISAYRATGEPPSDRK